MKDLFGRKLEIPHAKKKIWEVLKEVESSFGEDGERNLLLLILDGLPYFVAKEILPGAEALESTNISSTLPAITSLVFQEEPAAHGILSWSFYFEGLKGIYEPATSMLYPGVEVAADPEALTSSKPYLPEGFEEYRFFMLKKYTQSPWSKTLTKGYRVSGFFDFIHLRKMLSTVFRKRKSFFTVVYIHEPDYAMHQEGDYSFVKHVLSYVLWLLWPLRKRQSFKKTRVVLLSDHGHVPIEGYVAVPSGVEEAVNLPIAGESRDVFLYTSKGVTEKLLDAFEEIQDEFYVIDGVEALYNGFFGKDVSETAEKRVPTVLLSAKGPVSLLTSEELFLSSHGGLTQEEKLGFFFSAPAAEAVKELRGALKGGL